MIILPVDVEFELIWRQAGGGNVPIATWTEHFEPLGAGNFTAQPCELTAEAELVEWQEGDQLVYRYSGESEAQMAYIPIGNPITEGGRRSSITLPE